MIDSTTTSEVENEHESPFEVFKVLNSFQDPKSVLFMESLKAEMRRYPKLAKMTPKKAEKNPPNAGYFTKNGRRFVIILYTGVSQHPHACRNLCLTHRACRKGYYKCKWLCRVYLIDAFKAATTRGELFVRCVDPVTNAVHDNRNTLAHFITLFYAKKAEPAMQLVFHHDGSLKTNSVLFKQTRE